MQIQRIFKFLALACVFSAVAGILAFYKTFALIKVGPLFILEFLLLVWLICAHFAGGGLTEVYGILKKLKFVGLFFAIGLLLFLYSLFFLRNSATQESLMRIFQHGIVFVYPLAWSFVGYWTFSHSKKYAVWLAYLVVAVNFCFNLVGKPGLVTAATGPIGIIVGIALASEALNKKNSGPLRMRRGVQSLMLLFVTCLPYWVMWLNSMQRTSLLLLFLMMTIVPLLLRKAVLIPLIFVFFFTGLMVTTKIFSNLGLSGAFNSSMQHGEDIPRTPTERRFQLRTRSLLWHKALSQWQEHPFLGIGFVREVPELSQDDVLYIKGSPFDSALSGPHNSYLGVLARMGIVGLFVLLMALGNWFFKVKILLGRRHLFGEIMMVFIVINGAIYAAFNVGLESPQNCLLMWLFLGGTMKLASDKSTSFVK